MQELGAALIVEKSLLVTENRWWVWQDHKNFSFGFDFERKAKQPFRVGMEMNEDINKR